MDTFFGGCWWTLITNRFFTLISVLKGREGGRGGGVAVCHLESWRRAAEVQIKCVWVVCVCVCVCVQHIERERESE